MAPDFRGRTTGPWEPWLHALPAEFDSAQKVYDEFGPVAGQYFLEAFDRTATGWRLHGHTNDVDRDRRRVGHPRLLAAVGGGAGPRVADRGGQLRHACRGRCAEWQETGYRTTYLHVPGAGHLIHDDAPQIYQEAVESFLATLAHGT